MIAPGIEIVVQCGAEAADVEESCGTGGKSDSNLHIHGPAVERQKKSVLGGGGRLCLGLPRYVE